MMEMGLLQQERPTTSRPRTGQWKTNGLGERVPKSEGSQRRNRRGERQHPSRPAAPVTTGVSLGVSGSGLGLGASLSSSIRKTCSSSSHHQHPNHGPNRSNSSHSTNAAATATAAATLAAFQASLLPTAAKNHRSSTQLSVAHLSPLHHRNNNNLGLTPLTLTHPLHHHHQSTNTNNHLLHPLPHSPPQINPFLPLNPTLNPHEQLVYPLYSHQLYQPAAPVLNCGPAPALDQSASFASSDLDLDLVDLDLSALSSCAQSSALLTNTNMDDYIPSSHNDEMARMQELSNKYEPESNVSLSFPLCSNFAMSCRSRLQAPDAPQLGMRFRRSSPSFGSAC